MNIDITDDTDDAEYSYTENVYETARSAIKVRCPHCSFEGIVTVVQLGWMSGRCVLCPDCDGDVPVLEDGVS